MPRKTRDFDEMPSFRDLEQTAQVIPIRDAREARRSHGARRRRAAGEARPQRLVSVRIGPPVSSGAA